ncbi:triphosphoribosyl-dephospho-CoA synthase [Ideonella sp. DXS29W]|uniref:Triphosphoribosyl-dephospho-CoA synthase n=1 Tax=Ideonella lacteola TaxID=2984193 RepID=A0ABU9BIY4_9BURK
MAEAHPARQPAHHRARRAFLRACALDVGVRKPGNVSLASPGHGMQAEMFLRSAQAASEGLFAPGARVGARIEAAQAASWAAAGCNTNLGILLLCAPLAAAAEQAGPSDSLRATLQGVLQRLDLEDAAAAYRAIAAANPGGLGEAPEEDVHAAPRLSLRSAMVLAADRDLIARQYRDGYAGLFDVTLPVWQAAGLGRRADFPALDDAAPDARTTLAVQRVYLACLSSWPDSHIVRKHGEAVAQTVMRSAQAWRVRAEAGEVLDADPAFADWDAQLKAQGLNPGTSADLTVATLMLAGLIGSTPAAWHGSCL